MSFRLSLIPYRLILNINSLIIQNTLCIYSVILIYRMMQFKKKGKVNAVTTVTK